MTMSGEFLGQPAEAPTAVPASVHEHEPRHPTSIPASVTPLLGAKQWARPVVRASDVKTLRTLAHSAARTS